MRAVVSAAYCLVEGAKCACYFIVSAMFPAAGSVEMPFLRPCSLSSHRATSRGLLRYKPLYYLRPTRRAVVLST